MPTFCASCLAENVPLTAEYMNGKRVHLCADCREGELRGGRWSFGERAPRAMNRSTSARGINGR